MLETININEDICSNIIANYRGYMSIPSVSCNEDELAKKIMKDFTGIVNIAGCPVWIGNPKSLFIHICHIDRIPVDEYGVYSTLHDNDDVPILKGQLDNSICVAILKEMYCRGNLFNVIFTREEEICHPHFFVIKVLEELKNTMGREPKDWVLIDTDIDIAFRSDNWIDSISLRSHDSMEKFDPKTVDFCRMVAEDSDMPYSAKEDWVIGSIGFCSKTFGLRGTYVGLPILNYHTNKEIVSIETLNRYYEFMVSLNNRYTEFSKGDINGKEGINYGGNWTDRKLYDRVTIGTGV